MFQVTLVEWSGEVTCTRRLGVGRRLDSGGRRGGTFFGMVHALNVGYALLGAP